MQEIAVRHLAADAFEECVACCTVGIVTDSGTLPGAGIGTGVALRWRSRTLFVTAAHVIEGTPLERLGFFFCADGNVEREDVEEKVRGKRFTKPQQLRIIDVQTDRSRNLAGLSVSPEVEEQQNVSFIAFEGSHVSPRLGQTLMIQGFPFATNERIAPGSLAASRAIAYQKVVEGPRARNFDASAHFATAYTYGHCTPTGIDPAGFSGAGAWYGPNEEQQPTIWVPEPKLAGITATYYKRKKILGVIRVEVVLQFLEERFP